MVTTVCARLLVAFMLVDATVRLAVPTSTTHAHYIRPHTALVFAILQLVSFHASNHYFWSSSVSLCVFIWRLHFQREFDKDEPWYWHQVRVAHRQISVGPTFAYSNRKFHFHWFLEKCQSWWRTGKHSGVLRLFVFFVYLLPKMVAWYDIPLLADRRDRRMRRLFTGMHDSSHCLHRLLQENSV